MIAVEDWMEGGERRQEETRANKVTGIREGAGHAEAEQVMNVSRRRPAAALRRGAVITNARRVHSGNSLMATCLQRLWLEGEFVWRADREKEGCEER